MRPRGTVAPPLRVFVRDVVRRRERDSDHFSTTGDYMGKPGPAATIKLHRWVALKRCRFNSLRNLYGLRRLDHVNGRWWAVNGKSERLPIWKITPSF